MLEIILLLTCFAFMAKHGKRSSKGRYSLRPVRFANSITLGTLANITVLTAGSTSTADGAYRMISMQAVWTLKGGTTGEGPITVGYAHSDYSVTEIKEALEANASINIGNKVSNEQANRLVRIVGTFGGGLTDEQLNEGRPVKTRLNWFIPIGMQVNLFAYNDSGATLTTGSIVDVTGKCWVKDSQ